MSTRSKDDADRIVDEFCRAHAPQLFSYCRALLRAGDCHQDADDLVQEVFSVAIRKMFHAEPDGTGQALWLAALPPGAQYMWLRKTADNLNHARIRARWRDMVLPVALSPALDGLAIRLAGMAAEQQSPDQAVDDIALHEVLQHLPRQMRAVVELLLFEQFTPLEICAELGVDSGYVSLALAHSMPLLLEIYPHLARRWWTGEFDRWQPPKPVSALDHAVRRLTLRRREVVERYAEGKSHAQIAAELRISPGCVRVHLHNAVADLMQALDADRDAVLAQLHASARVAA